MRAALAAATRRRGARARCAPQFPARASPASSTSCWPTRRSTRSCSPRRCRRTPTSPCACSRPASTASSRSRWRSRSPTPSAPSRPPSAAGKVLMVGHLLEYHPGVDKLKEIADSGELGDIHYIYGNRLNLGKLRADENALWSLGAHDVSVVLRLAGEEPVRGHARGESYMRAGDRGRRLRLPALPVGPVRAPAPVAGSTRTRSGASRSSAPSGWRRSTTWRSSASSPSTTRASTRTSTPTASTSRARATSGARGCPNDEPLRLECQHFLDCVARGPRAAVATAQRATRRARARGAAAGARRDRGGAAASDRRDRAAAGRRRRGRRGRRVRRRRRRPRGA